MGKNARTLLATFVLFVVPLGLLAQTTIEYDPVTLYQWQGKGFPDAWDLTACDLTLSYTLDLSTIATAGWSVVEVGLREVGAPNIDPNYRGGWLLSRWSSAAQSDTRADLNDYHVLMKHGWLDECYDRDENGDPMACTPPWRYTNYAFWFDRGGVDMWQQNMWNYQDGVTYNTAGLYDVVIDYAADNAGTGTMYATLNGRDDPQRGPLGMQGLYTQGYRNEPPARMPVGRTFVGDMTRLVFFTGRGGGGGTVTVSDIAITGCLGVIDVALDVRPGSSENQINSNARMLVPIAILGRANFDPVSSVDIATVVIHGAMPSLTSFDTDDVNGDGYPDLTLYFRARDFRKPDPVTECGNPDATVEMEPPSSTYQGAPLQGSDHVRWLGPDCG
jgi:hypothetical protein